MAGTSRANRLDHFFLSMSRPLSGLVKVTRNGDLVWAGDNPHATVVLFERRARSDPDADWRIRFVTPTCDETYRRVADNRWHLIARGHLVVGDPS